MFIGIYNYTTFLSYLNLLSGFLGISIIAFTKEQHIIYSTICLLICGICDMLDGIISRTKKNRSIFEKKYGIQIDSLADIISFGFLPIFINFAFIKKLDNYGGAKFYTFNNPSFVVIFCLLSAFYILSALIRLSYFNVTSDEKLTKNNINNEFIGIPVTTSSIIFPILILFYIFIENILTQNDVHSYAVNCYFVISFIYSFFIFSLTFLFICSKIKIKKPGKLLRNIFILLSFIIIFLLITMHHKQHHQNNFVSSFFENK